MSGSSTLSGAVNLQSNSTAYVHNGGNYTLTFSGTLDLGSSVLTLQTTGSNNGAIISGVLTGTSSSGIVKNGAGPLTMSADGTGYSGTTSLMSGEILVGSDTAFGTGVFAISPPNNSTVTVRSTGTAARTIGAAVTLPTTTNNGNASGRFVFGSTNVALNGSLTFTNTAAIDMGSASRTFEVHNRTQFNAGFTGLTRGITLQTGTGTLVMNGTSTYTGATTVNAGTLLVNGSLDALSAVTVNTGARIGGTGAVGGVTFNTGAALAYEVATAAQGGDGLTTTGFSGTGIGSFTVYLSGAATGFNSGSNYTWAVLTSNSTDMASVSLAGITLDTSGFGPAFTGSFNLTKDATTLYVNYVGSMIPEPSTYSLLAGGAILGLALLRRRRA